MSQPVSAQPAQMQTSSYSGLVLVAMHSSDTLWLRTSVMRFCQNVSLRHCQTKVKSSAADNAVGQVASYDMAQESAHVCNLSSSQLTGCPLTGNSAVRSGTARLRFATAETYLINRRCCTHSQTSASSHKLATYRQSASVDFSQHSRSCSKPAAE